MIVSLVVAMDERGGIGKDNQVPWRLPADLKHFKEMTMGHHLIMGRKTFESIGKPLPGRTTIVITRNPAFHPESCLVAHDIQEALSIAQARGETEAFIVGGGQIYEQALRIADRIYLTQVHTKSPADVFFPGFERMKFIEKESYYHPADEKNPYPFTFKLLVKA